MVVWPGIHWDSPAKRQSVVAFSLASNTPCLISGWQIVCQLLSHHLRAVACVAVCLPLPGKIGGGLSLLRQLLQGRGCTWDRTHTYLFPCSKNNTSMCCHPEHFCMIHSGKLGEEALFSRYCIRDDGLLLSHSLASNCWWLARTANQNLDGQPRQTLEPLFPLFLSRFFLNGRDNRKRRKEKIMLTPGLKHLHWPVMCQCRY